MISSSCFSLVLLLVIYLYNCFDHLSLFFFGWPEVRRRKMSANTGFYRCRVLSGRVTRVVNLCQHCGYRQPQGLAVLRLPAAMEMDLLTSDVTLTSKRTGQTESGQSGDGPPTKKHKKPKAGDEGQTCIVAGCETGRHHRTRFCYYHKTSYDCMYYRYVTKPRADIAKMSNEQLKARGWEKIDRVQLVRTCPFSDQAEKEAEVQDFIQSLQDDNETAAALGTFTQMNISSKKFSRKQTVASVEFRRRFKTIVGNRDENEERPFEREEWVKRLVDKKGWTRIAVCVVTAVVVLGLRV
eukprot:4328489-Amphidinium_carterae.1